MPADETIALDEVRAEIDRIDDAVLALLGERMAAVEAVRRAKAGEPAQPVTAVRPGREAQIIRRLVAARSRQVPARLVERVWREIIATATHVQVPLAVHASGVALDLVHARFGAMTPVVSHERASAAVRAVSPLGADIAVVAVQAGDDWVTPLLEGRAAAPRVIACLPFLDDGTGPLALAIGHAPAENTGDDTTVVALQGTGKVPLEPIGTSGRWRLAGAQGLVSENSQLMNSLRADPALEAVAIVGSFANPILLPDQV